MINRCFFLYFILLLSCNNPNDIIKVPNFDGVHVMNLDSLVDSFELRYSIIDSVFDKSRQKGVVINQDPLPNSDVKKNRRIYLTINALNDRKVAFPDIFDLTLRQAVSKLQKDGFEVGDLEYRNYIATNKVLAFKVNGSDVKVGQELYHGTVIDLVVGKESNSKKILVPNVVGLSRREANIVLKSTSLNIGLEYFNDSVADSTSAIIYKQYPSAGDRKMISIGSSVDLYFDLKKQDSL